MSFSSSATNSALPIVLIDTAPMIRLSDAAIEITRNRGDGADIAAVGVLRKILDGLMQDGSRTCIFTHRIFEELLPLKKLPEAQGIPIQRKGPALIKGREMKSLSIYSPDKKNIGFPQELGEAQLKYPNAEILYEMFRGYARQGKIRCYATLQDMIDQGELDAPKGGIVIVDTGVAQGADRDLSERDPQTMGFYLNWGLHIAAHRYNSGDDTLVHISEAVIAHSRNRGIPARFMVLNEDKKLGQRLVESSQQAGLTHARAPLLARGTEMLSGIAESEKTSHQSTVPADSLIKTVREHEGHKFVHDADVINSVAQWLDESARFQSQSRGTYLQR
jgi:hypothetical protein